MKKGSYTVEDYEKEILAKICKECHIAVMQHHHQFRDYMKCPQCGYMEKCKEINTEKLIDNGALDKLDEEKD